MRVYDNRRRRVYGVPEICMFCGVFLALLVKFFFLNASITARPYWHFPEGIGANGAVLLALLAPMLLLPRRVRGFALMLSNFLLSLLIVTDLLTYRYFSDIFTLRNLALSAQIDDVASSIFSLLQYSDAFYFADLLFFFPLALWLWGRPPRRVSTARVAVVSLLVLIGTAGGFLRAWEFGNRTPGALRAMWDRPAVATGLGALLYHAADLQNVVGDMIKKGASPEDVETVHAWLKSRPVPAMGQSGAKRHNLLVVQVEALQSFVMGMSVGGREVTPNLNALSREGLYFPLVFAQTAAGNTADAELMLNTGLYPAASGVAFTRFSGNRYDGLGGKLSEMGYVTSAFHANKPGFWNRGAMYKTLGFSRFYSLNDFPKTEPVGFGPSDRLLYDVVYKKLSAMKKPWYAMVVTLSSHHPFDFANLRRVAVMPAGEYEGTFFGDYLKAINYADAQLGAFIVRMRKSGYLKDTVIAIYGDHTAIPFGSAEMSRATGVDLSKPWALKNMQTVPLILLTPDMGHRVYNVSAGQIDIGATLAAMFGVPMPMSMGRSLFEPSGSVVFRNGQIIKGNAWINGSDATDMLTGSSLDVRNYSADVYFGHKALEVSDLIQEHNMGRMLLD